MANITKIKEQARELCLMTIADPNFDMQHADEKSLDYLEHILGLELENRRQNAIARFRKVCNLPHIRFDIGRVKSDVRSQLERLLECKWADECRNLVITGACGAGKTVLATHIANAALEKGHRVFYIKLEEMLIVLAKKDSLEKASVTYNKIKNADVLVLDEMLYLNLSRQDLETAYRTLMFINDTTSIIFITNRESSELLREADEKYTMRLLIERALTNADVIRL